MIHMKAGRPAHVQAECAHVAKIGGPMISDNNGGDTTTSRTDPPPAIVISHRYRPRVCAGPDCILPPHVRWRVSHGGYLYGRYRRIGDPLDLCDVHEREAADLCGGDWGDKPQPMRQPTSLPEPRRQGAA